MNASVIRGYANLAEYTGVSVASLKKWRKTEQLPAAAVVHITKRTVFFRREVIDAWLSGEQNTPTKRTPGRPRKERGKVA